MEGKQSNTQIKNKAELIHNESTAKQKEYARSAAERQKEAARRADEAASGLTMRLDQIVHQAREQEQRAEKAEKQLEQEREDTRKREELLNSSLKLTQGALGKVKRNVPGYFLRGLIAGIIIGAVGFYFLIMPRLMPQNKPAPTPSSEPVASQDVTIEDNGVLGFTAADFKEAVIGGASEHQELIVMEQPLSITTTVTKAGLGSFQIFSKMKNVTYYGKGIYTVDLSGIDSDHVLVDEDRHQVTIRIPHSVLQYLNAELDKTEFEDTQNGLLAFGDIKLTAEETRLLEQSVYDAMDEKLRSAELFAEADEFAKLKTWEIFQPLVSAVSPMYTVAMEFEN